LHLQKGKNSRFNEIDEFLLSDKSSINNPSRLQCQESEIGLVEDQFLFDAEQIMKTIIELSS
jgi:hypothetical protein